MDEIIRLILLEAGKYASGDPVRDIYSVKMDISMRLGTIMRDMRKKERALASHAKEMEDVFFSLSPLNVRDSILPKTYTLEEGGKIYPWPQDRSISHSELSSVKLGCRHVILQKMQIHSLLFAPYGRWDTVNGWN